VHRLTSFAQGTDAERYIGQLLRTAPRCEARVEALLTQHTLEDAVVDVMERCVVVVVVCLFVNPVVWS
jgi:hypothetical protein